MRQQVVVVLLREGLVLLPHFFSSFRDYQSIVVGAILITVLLFEPMGMRGRWLRIKYYFKAWPF